MDSGLFGRLAQRLEARAVVAGAHPWQTPGRAHLRCAAWALARSERQVLTEQAGAQFLAESDPSEGEGRGRLTEIVLPAAALAECAGLGPALELLHQTQRNASRRPQEGRILGVVNVTPDSFSDGGRYLDPERAIEHGLRLVDEGADILDVGGESTRPGSEAVGAEEELKRVLPVISGLAERVSVPISIDTQKAIVAAQALDAGATWVNDVSGGTTDPEMVSLVAERDAHYVLMHMQGTPASMQDQPRYGDVVREVFAWLRERVGVCLKAGIHASKIAIDPGIGFGKRLGDNLALIRAVPELRSLGLPVLLGVSRKSFLSALTGAPKEAEKVGETAAAVALGVSYGAEWLRVHDVATMRSVLRVAEALTFDRIPGPANR